jgi:hypothetical protein
MNPENEAGSPQDEKAAQVVHGHSRTARRYFIFAAIWLGFAIANLIRGIARHDIGGICLGIAGLIATVLYVKAGIMSRSLRDRMWEDLCYRRRARE